MTAYVTRDTLRRVFHAALYELDKIDLEKKVPMSNEEEQKEIIMVSDVKMEDIEAERVQIIEPGTKIGRVIEKIINVTAEIKRSIIDESDYQVAVSQIKNSLEVLRKKVVKLSDLIQAEFSDEAGSEQDMKD